MCRKLFVLFLVLTFVASASAALKGNWQLDDNATNSTVVATVGTDGTLMTKNEVEINTNTVHSTDYVEATGSFDLPTNGVTSPGNGEQIKIDNSTGYLDATGAYTVMFWICSRLDHQRRRLCCGRWSDHIYFLGSAGG